MHALVMVLLHLFLCHCGNNTLLSWWCCLSSLFSHSMFSHLVFLSYSLCHSWLFAAPHFCISLLTCTCTYTQNYDFYWTQFCALSNIWKINTLQHFQFLNPFVWCISPDFRFPFVALNLMIFPLLRNLAHLHGF